MLNLFDLFVFFSFFLCCLNEAIVSSSTIDIENCGKTKGCLRNPPDCSSSSQCTQIVTWTVSPDDPAAVRFEMTTSLTSTKGPIKYIAFALAPDYNSIMSNGSVLVCSINQTSSSSIVAYLAHTANRAAKPLPIDQYQSGIQLIGSKLTESTLTCIVDQKIVPSPQITPGLIFPLYHSFYPSLAAGTADSNGILGRHYAKTKSEQPVTTTDFTQQTSIAVSLCGVAQGCLRDPDGCQSLDDCRHVIAWNVLQSGTQVRFQMATVRKYDYIALGLANSSDPDGFMGNGQVLACALDQTSSTLKVFQSYNRFLSKEEGYESVIATQGQGLEPLLFHSASSHHICVFNQAVRPTDENSAEAFLDLSLPWYPAWAAGPTQNGKLTYHRSNRVAYHEKIVCTTPLSPHLPSDAIHLKWYKFLHAVFMMAGWMVCAPCFILAPRYFRVHWAKPMICGNHFWFFVHRTLIQIGIAFVIVGLVLIIVGNKFHIEEMGPGMTSSLHSHLGIIAIALLLLNSIGSLCRGKPGSKLRKVFKWLHGISGAVGFVMAAVVLILGGVMMYSDLDSLALYPIIVWAGLHGIVEIVLPTINVYFRSTKSVQKSSQLDAEGKPQKQVLSADERRQKRKTIFNAIVLAHFFACLALTAMASVFVFVEL